MLLRVSESKIRVRIRYCLNDAILIFDWLKTESYNIISN